MSLRRLVKNCDELEDEAAHRVVVSQGRRSAVAPVLLPPPAVVPLLSDQFPVPTQDRVRCEEGADLFQHFAAQDLSLPCETPWRWSSKKSAVRAVKNRCRQSGV